MENSKIESKIDEKTGKQIDPEWLTKASKELGIKEISGLTHQPKILIYHMATTKQPTADEVPWCSSFVNWVMKECSIQGTGSTLARSWIRWGKKIQEPKRGAIVVLKRGNEPWMGHVGFYLGRKIVNEQPVISILGGNQNNSVCIKEYPESSVISYHWPSQDDIISLNQQSSRGSRESGHS